jgi:hypothetical protein
VAEGAADTAGADGAGSAGAGVAWREGAAWSEGETWREGEVLMEGDGSTGVGMLCTGGTAGALLSCASEGESAPQNVADTSDARARATRTAAVVMRMRSSMEGDVLAPTKLSRVETFSQSPMARRGPQAADPLYLQ